MPQTNPESVKMLVEETIEAESVLMRLAASPITRFEDITAELSRLKAARISGAGLLRVVF